MVMLVFTPVILPKLPWSLRPRAVEGTKSRPHSGDGSQVNLNSTRTDGFYCFVRGVLFDVFVSSALEGADLSLRSAALFSRFRAAAFDRRLTYSSPFCGSAFSDLVMFRGIFP